MAGCNTEGRAASVVAFTIKQLYQYRLVAWKQALHKNSETWSQIREDSNKIHFKMQIFQETCTEECFPLGVAQTIFAYCQLALASTYPNMQSKMLETPE